LAEGANEGTDRELSVKNQGRKSRGGNLGRGWEDCRKSGLRVGGIELGVTLGTWFRYSHQCGRERGRWTKRLGGRRPKCPFRGTSDLRERATFKEVSRRAGGLERRGVVGRLKSSGWKGGKKRPKGKLRTEIDG